MCCRREGSENKMICPLYLYGCWKRRRSYNVIFDRYCLAKENLSVSVSAIFLTACNRGCDQDQKALYCCPNSALSVTNTCASDQQVTQSSLRQKQIANSKVLTPGSSDVSCAVLKILTRNLAWCPALCPSNIR